jgi:hypothetical protein
MDTNTNPLLIVLSGAPDKQQPTGYRGAKALRIVAAALISLLGALILAARINPARMDYIEYWSSAHLLIHRANPYSPAGVLALEKVHGFLSSGRLIMANPPWALFLIVPLGMLGIHTGLVLWILMAGGCILGSVRLFDPGSKDSLLALLFAPAIACFGSGQSSPFLLLGCTLFLYFHHNRPFAAGAALLLMAIKPHLFLVFWVVLLADCIYRRNFLVLAGAASALAAATAFAMLMDPRIWPHYLATMRSYQLQHAALPTTSMLFRRLIDPHAFWLLFVPSAIAVLWGLWYFSRLRHVWDWRVHGMLLMLVTVLVSPYGFFTDEIVLLPSIIFALNFAGKRKYSGWILLVINGIAALVFMALGASLASPAYLWTPLAWLGWFLYATYRPGHRSQSSEVRLPATSQTGQVG